MPVGWEKLQRQTFMKFPPPSNISKIAQRKSKAEGVEESALCSYPQKLAF